MTIVVAYKWASDPGEASVDSAGAIDWSRARAAISEYDPVAIGVGRELADAQGAELIGISLGPAATASAMAKKAAMSRGFDRATVVADDVTQTWNRTQTAFALAELVRRAGGEILLTGDAAIDEPARMMGPLIAGYLSWPCFGDVHSVTKTAAGWLLSQHVAGGTRTLEVTGPVVVAVTTDALVPKIPGMKDILEAGKKPVEEVAVADLGVPVGTVKSLGQAKPTARARRQRMFAGENAAADLAAALAADQVL